MLNNINISVRPADIKLPVLCIMYSVEYSEILCLRHRIQTASVTHPASYPMGTGSLSSVIKRQGVKLTTHLHLMPR